MPPPTYHSTAHPDAQSRFSPRLHASLALHADVVDELILRVRANGWDKLIGFYSRVKLCPPSQREKFSTQVSESDIILQVDVTSGWHALAGRG